MAFFENVGAEVIGGIIGGLVVLFAGSIWYRFRTFEMRFINPKETITAENMRTYTALRTETGECYFRIILRPRRGMTLKKGSFAFFEKGRLPWLVGRRRSTNEAKIKDVRCFDHDNKKFKDENFVKSTDNDNSSVTFPEIDLPPKTCTYLECYAEINDSLKSWEGILGFKIHFERDGNPDQKYVNTKFFVRASDQKRPLRSIFKKVLKATMIE